MGARRRSRGVLDLGKAAAAAHGRGGELVIGSIFRCYRDAHPLKAVVNDDLAGKARVRLGERGKAQHAGLLRIRLRGAGHAEPSLVDIDMTGGAGTFAAAIGVDSGDIVVDCPAHNRQASRHLDPVLAAPNST